MVLLNGVASSAARADRRGHSIVRTSEIAVQVVGGDASFACHCALDGGHLGAVGYLGALLSVLSFKHGCGWGRIPLRRRVVLVPDQAAAFLLLPQLVCLGFDRDLDFGT